MTALDTILQEMFVRVGRIYNPPLEDNWYASEEWTQEDENDFALWMQDYLLNDNKARKEFMKKPLKNAEVIQKTVKEFLSVYGWRVKQTKRSEANRR